MHPHAECGLEADSYQPPRFCATAWLGGHDFCVLSSVLEFWFMVSGFVFEKLPFGGGTWSPASSRFFGLTPQGGLLPELLAASGSFQERLGIPVIDSRC